MLEKYLEMVACHKVIPSFLFLTVLLQGAGPVTPPGCLPGDLLGPPAPCQAEEGVAVRYVGVARPASG